MPYQCPFLLLHHSLDVASFESGTDCIFNPPNLLEDLLWCNVHVSAQGRGRGWELMDVDVKVKRSKSTITCIDQQTSQDPIHIDKYKTSYY
jgi:hypothetical protein